jgi:hypothetical protein
MDLVAELTRRGLPTGNAEALAHELAEMPGQLAPSACWRRVTETLLRPDMPLPVHQFAHQHVFRDWQEAAQGPRPFWQPTEAEIARTNIGALMRGASGRA